MMYEKKRLHPVTIIFNMLKPIKNNWYFVIPMFLALDFLYFFLILIGVLLLDFLYGFLAWHRFSYYVTEEALQLEYGIFKRTKRSISKNRIQAIDLTETVLHRLFKLAQVKIETASSGFEAEASLTAVTLDEGEQIRNILKRQPIRTEITTDVLEPTYPVQKITMERLILAGLTSGGAGMILALLFAAALEMEEFISEEIYEYTFQWITSTSFAFIALIGAAVLIIVWAASVLWNIIRYGNFTIKRQDDELLIARGILERKQMTIPIQRIQAIVIEENILRQPFGYATIIAEVAGGDLNDTTDNSIILFPILHKREIQEFLLIFIEEFAWEEDGDWTKAKRIAIPFYLFRSSFWFLLAGILVFFIFPTFVWIPSALLVLALVRGWLCYKDAGFHIDGNRLTIRYRFISRMTVRLYHKRIQAYRKKQNPLQRKAKLATFEVSILSNLGGRHMHVNDMEEDKIDRLSDSFSHRKIGQSGTDNHDNFTSTGENECL